MNTKSHEIDKVAAVSEEIEASFKLISAGLKSLKEQTSFISSNHVPLQLLSSGFERVLKILLLLKEKYLTGKYPELKHAREKFKNYSNGHGIEKMLDELIDYSKTIDFMQQVPMVKNDLEFVEYDKSFREFLKIITDFSIQQRYYYIDSIILEITNQNFNPFDQFKTFIYSFGDDVDLTKLTYEKEEKLLLNASVICIEKGVRAIARFFTHGLGNLGKQYYSAFSSFILLNDKDLGLLKYTEKTKLPADNYKPISTFSFSFLSISMFSKTKTLHSKFYKDWVFKVKKVTVYSHKTNFFFVKIGWKIYALTGETSSQFKTPNYLSSKKLKPKASAPFLLEEAKAYS